MRTKTLLVAAALTAAGIISSLAQSNVYSLNIVGYVNRTAPGNAGFTLLGNPLDSGSNTLNGVLASFLPAQSKVLKWNGTSFTTITRTAGGWLGGSQGNTTVNPGEGFFVQTPSGSADIPITFVGEVKQGNLTNDYQLAFNLTADQAPESGSLPSLQFAPPTGTRVLVWTGSAYSTRTWNGSIWLGGAPSINVGDGFFVNTLGGPFQWVRNFSVQ